MENVKESKWTYTIWFKIDVESEPYIDDFSIFRFRIFFLMISLNTCSEWKLGKVFGNVPCVFYNKMIFKLVYIHLVFKLRVSVTLINSI